MNQPEDVVNEQNLEGNFVDINASRQNVHDVTDYTSNTTMQLVQTRPTDIHRNDYANMYQPLVRDRNDSHCYSQCI